MVDSNGTVCGVKCVTWGKTLPKAMLDPRRWASRRYRDITFCGTKPARQDCLPPFHFALCPIRKADTAKSRASLLSIRIGHLGAAEGAEFDALPGGATVRAGGVVVFCGGLGSGLLGRGFCAVCHRIGHERAYEDTLQKVRETPSHRTHGRWRGRAPGTTAHSWAFPVTTWSSRSAESSGSRHKNHSFRVKMKIRSNCANLAGGHIWARFVISVGRFTQIFTPL